MAVWPARRLPATRPGRVTRRTPARCLSIRDAGAWAAAPRGIGGHVQIRQGALELDVAGGDLLVIDVVELDSLAEREQVLGAVVLAKGSRDHLDGLLAADVPQRSQLCRVALPVENRPEDAHTRHPSNVADNMVEL